MATHAPAPVLPHPEPWSARLQHARPDSTTSLTSAFQWVHSALDRILHTSLLTSTELLAVFANRRLTCSSAFSGIGTPEVAHQVITRSTQAYFKNAIPHTGEQATLNITTAYAVEWNTACRAELKVLPHGPSHIFGNMIDFCTYNIKVQCGLLPKHTPKPNSFLRNVMPRAPCCLTAFCHIHNQERPAYAVSNSLQIQGLHMHRKRVKNAAQQNA